VLDGFDLGVGVLHLFTRDDHERRVGLNAIAPIWDGNEVWLLTGGGALFAAFPIVYATVFSAFYLAFYLLLLALIARAVAIEFRGKVDSPRWRQVWDWAFGLGSAVPALLYGVAFANILRGIPLSLETVFSGSGIVGPGAGGPAGATTTWPLEIMFTGSFFGLLNPYAILLGILSVAMFTLHGSLYLIIKSDGAMQARLRRWVAPLWIAVVVLVVIAMVSSMLAAPFLFEGLRTKPLFWVAALLTAVGLLSLPLLARGRRDAGAFLASTGLIVGLMTMAAAALFPRLTPAITRDSSYPGGDCSLTIYNASSTPRTLMVMLVIALIGVPIMLVYTAFIYRCFKGKTIVTAEGY
jgi:cytochrome d ubiquinol oxidase subunit II